MGEFQGVGAGPVGFGGAACSAAFGGAGLSGEDWTPPETGSPAAGFGSPVGGGAGDFVSSGIAKEGTNLRRHGRLEER